MQGSRVSTREGRIKTAFLLMCLAMLMRLPVPAGWMPVETATGGWAISLCTGSGAMQLTMAGPMPAATKGMHHGADQQDRGSGDHPCAFSSLAMALDEPPPLVIDLPKLVFETWIASSGIAVAIGRGLAAPPPRPRGRRASDRLAASGGHGRVPAGP